MDCENTDDGVRQVDAGPWRGKRISGSASQMLRVDGLVLL
jgi:hypothetical protein